MSLGSSLGSSLGCSRRALLKQRKLCLACQRRPATMVEAGVTEEALRFCSQSCVETYKLQIFTRETMACLSSATTAGSSSEATTPTQTSPASTSEAVKSPPAKPKPQQPKPAATHKRRQQPRPHPSHLLNKRLWEEAAKERFPIASPTLKLPRKESPPPTPQEIFQLKPSMPAFQLPALPQPFPPLPTLLPSPTFPRPLLFVPLPIPVPIPVPLPLPVSMEDFLASLEGRRAESDWELD